MAADCLVDTDAGVHLLELQTGLALSIDDPVSKAVFTNKNTVCRGAEGETGHN